VEHFSLLLDTERKADETVDVLAPFDGTPIASIDCGGMDHVDEALGTAYSLFRNRDEWLEPPQRIAILERAIELMAQQSDLLAVEAAREGGKPLRDSEVEVSRAIDGLKLCIEVLRSEQGSVVPMNVSEASKHRIAFTQKEPIGVVVAVSAFNHPLNLVVHQVAAAVAAGCPVIVKPAQDTPLSCMRFVQILHAAGLPKSWCQAMVTSTRAAATALVTDARVGFFSFIGSPGVGWSLRSQLAPGTRCALEHGGAAPAIIAQDANLEDAVPLLAKGGFYHAGQVCVSVQRIFAHRSIAKELTEKLAREAGKMIVGDPVLAKTDIGPLIRPAELERVHEWVQEAVDEGAELVCGGEPIDTHCYPCTVLFEPPAQARVSRQEIFGPVICVYAFDDIDEAIERANSLPFAFQAAVFTQNLDVALRVYKRLDASAVMINDHTAFRVDGMPFAGLRQSGLGVGGIGHSIADMQIEKMALIRSPEL
jgi:acyl-CoA reductase-like NAD-dependent aldehyde dehydrogenase